MSFEELQKIQSEIPTDLLIERGREWISKLCKSGGKAWSLRVPVDPENDPDLIFSEIMRRLAESQNCTNEIYITYDKSDGEVFCAFVDKSQCEKEVYETGCGMMPIRLINLTNEQ